MKEFLKKERVTGMERVQMYHFLSDRQRVKIYTEGKVFINFSEGKG